MTPTIIIDINTNDHHGLAERHGIKWGDNSHYRVVLAYGNRQILEACHYDAMGVESWRPADNESLLKEMLVLALESN